MFKITYTKNGSAFADYMVEGILRMHENYECRVSTENMIYAARVLVAEGVIPLDQMEIYYENDDGYTIRLDLDEKGKIAHWPEGFCDKTGEFLYRLVKI